MKALLKLLDTITCKIQEYIMIITCVAVTVLIGCSSHALHLPLRLLRF